MPNADGGGALRTAFDAVAFKTLTVVETDARKSNQHEFNGSRALQSLFGDASPQRIPTEFVWMPDDGEFVRQSGLLTWYDARARHPTRSEYRLYYVGNSVTERARAGDFLVIARRRSGPTLLLLAPGGGPAAARIAWMFGIEAQPGAAFASILLRQEDRSRIRALGSGHDISEDEAWSAQETAPLTGSDTSIRSSLMQMQQEIGRTRTVEPATEWSPDT